MYQQKDFDYYFQLRTLVQHSLLHLYGYLADSTRFVSVNKRNEILIKYLKPKLKDRRLTAIRSELRRMLSVGRNKQGNLEMALNEINDNIQQIHLNGTLKLYALMDYLAKEEGLPSKLFVEGETPQYGVLYLLEEHITQGFDVETGEQLAPVSILVQHERAQELVPVILRHGTFLAELKEWNSSKQQAHIVIHPVI